MREVVKSGVIELTLCAKATNLSMRCWYMCMQICRLRNDAMEHRNYTNATKAGNIDALTGKTKRALKRIHVLPLFNGPGRIRM